MLLSPYEIELVKAVASDPTGVTRRLISPEVGMASSWFLTPLGLRFFSALARNAVEDKDINFISVARQCELSSAEYKYLITIWNEGKLTGSANVDALANALRNEAMARSVNQAWDRYVLKLKVSPDEIRNHINEMGADLSSISHDGIAYNPDPTTHYDDADVVIGSSWGSSVLDHLYGGVPNLGYGLFVAPSGYGKSSFSRSVVVYSVIRSVMRERTEVLIAVNEMRGGVTSRGIRDALRDMWGEDRGYDDIDDDIRRNVKMYEDVYSYTRFEQMVYWHRPNIAIIDSLDALGFPAYAEKYKDEKDRHQARAIALNDLSIRNGTFIIVPANASGENQLALKQNKIAKIFQTSAFGSAWYEGKSTYATVMTWDKENPGVSLFMNTKSRPYGQKGVGHVYPMVHSDRGHYYRDGYELDLNEIGS